MGKIRINELARELEVKAHEILEKLPELGVADKKTHSSSLEDDVVLKLRRYYGHEDAESPSSTRHENASEDASDNGGEDHPPTAFEPAPVSNGQPKSQPIAEADGAAAAQAEAVVKHEVKHDAKPEARHDVRHEAGPREEPPPAV